MENLNKDGANGVFFLSSDLKILKAKYKKIHPKIIEVIK